MRAVIAARQGGPEVLAFVNVPTPVPAANEVLVKVHATSVNRADSLQRQGRYDLPPDSSPILGLDVAGVVVEAGEAVKSLKAGDRVFGLTAGGGYADFVAVPEELLMPVPKSMTLVEAAAIPEAFLTAFDNLVLRGGAGKGEQDYVLVHGGSGGVGTAAIQILKRLGCVVLVTSGSARKLAACEELGADRSINYKEEDFAAVAKDVTNGRGVDIVLDHVGANYFRRNLRSLAVGGRLILIGTLSGAKATIDLADITAFQHTVTGSRLRPRSVAAKGQLVTAFHVGLLPAFESGELRPVIDRVLPFERVIESHVILDGSEHFGKIVLEVQAEAQAA